MNFLDHDKKDLIQWSKMFKLWEKENVPEVKVKDYIFEKHVDGEPWYLINKDVQLLFQESKICQMGNLLAYYFPGLNNPEVSAAFKIDAFLRNYYGSTYFERPINKAFNKHNIRILEFWYYNTRYVLPDNDVDVYKIGSDFEAKDWKKVTQKAAEVWREIAEIYAVILLPAFMDKNSDQYKKYQQKYDQYMEKKEQNMEEKEYRNYLKLKNKYES